ncbi:HAD-IA family hydrolase [Inhella proteolytica]|uniref:HAD-IA family hydrolase n=1 Tax=Inhella proteolytica TaxID=2795029 RepID=UPI002873EA50|nr:HAD-IA family hydrolase [Inhella proteolytica]
MTAIRALTLDLDETLWPIQPVIERAEAELHAWLRQHAAATAARFDVPALQALRDAVALEFPDRAHDFTWLRRESIERALVLAGDAPELAEPAFEHFFEWRHRVVLFDDALPALQRLCGRYPILALTNGNAELARIGLAPYFVGRLSAREFGRGKPHADFFHAACSQLGLTPDQVLHVGDDWALDIEGAHGAGQPSAWICRPHHAAKPAWAQAKPWFEGADLLQLADRLGA